MKRIILHWTAGGVVPTSYEKNFYHFLVDSIGKIHVGKFKPIANEHCVKGMYAAHCGGGNTGSIGVALCGMADFKNKNWVGHFPITKIQFEKAMKFVAELSVQYKFPITKDTVMTHYEFGQTHPKTTSFGKIDICYIPPYPWVLKEDVGNFIRGKVKWYRENIRSYNE